MEETKSDNPRQQCPDCKKWYRYDVDFQEHKNVGCKAKSGKKKTNSLKEDPDSAPKE